MTERQINILRLLAKGYTITEITHAIHYERTTVQKELRAVYSYFGINGRKTHGKAIQAVAIAMRRGIIT